MKVGSTVIASIAAVLVITRAAKARPAAGEVGIYVASARRRPSNRPTQLRSRATLKPFSRYRTGAS